MNDVKIIDNSDEVLDEFQRKVGLALKAIGVTAEGYAKEDCPVDTGRLRNSIANEVADAEKAVYIGTNVEYAQEVEFNDKVKHRTGKAHFLRDAATKHGDEYNEIIKEILKS